MPPKSKPPTITYASKRTAALPGSPAPVKKTYGGRRSVVNQESLSSKDELAPVPAPPTKTPAKRRRFVPLPATESAKESEDELVTTKTLVGRRRFNLEATKTPRAKKGQEEQQKLQETTTNTRRSTRTKGVPELKVNGRDAEESLSELSRSPAVVNGKARGGRRSTGVAEGTPATGQKRKVKDIYDAPSSDDELSRPAPTPRTRTAQKGRTADKMVNGKDSENTHTPVKKRAKTVAEDGDEDVITVNGKIALAVSIAKKTRVWPPVAVSTAKEVRPTKARPSLGTEGLKDPFEAGPDRMDIDEPPEPPVVRVAKPTKVAGDLNVTAEEVQELQKIVMGKLMGRAPVDLVGLDDEYTAVHQLMSQTITAGEGNSLLLIGARGSGKSALVNAAIASLTSTHAGEFHLVRLSGLLQTDDKLALREIWRQLGLEMELPETETAPSNFADTLASLLAMLSHPDELTGEAAEEGTTTTAVLFILDEFDLFTIHPRQTLLYNLFDIAQSRKAPIAVIGSTTRLEVLESLEKRVKSRFSHRTMHIKLPASVDEYWDVVRAGLEVPPTSTYHEQWNDAFLPNLRSWPDFSRILKHAYAYSKTPATVWTALLPVIAALSPANPFPASAATPHSLAPPPSNLSLLRSLSDVQTALLIAAARLEVLCDAEAVGWEMVYDEYLSLCSRASIKGRVWGRQVARAAWEALEDVGLVVPVKRGMGLWRVEIGLMEVRGELGGIAGWGRWCKEVV